LAGASLCVNIWDFGCGTSGSARDKIILHTALHNDDNENEGVEILVEIYTGA
jgi:hypothetical protein